MISHRTSFKEKLVFFKKYLRNPNQLGSITPSSQALAISIANAVRQLPQIKVVEIGPGSGVITQEILEFKPELVEIDDFFYQHLKQKFPELSVIHGCALEYLKNITQTTGVIITIPLINNPLSDNLIKCLAETFEKGHIEWLVLFTYGFKNPLKKIPFSKSNRHEYIIKNIPPANIWRYER